jgi:hypothetical protein
MVILTEVAQTAQPPSLIGGMPIQKRFFGFTHATGHGIGRFSYASIIFGINSSNSHGFVR